LSGFEHRVLCTYQLPWLAVEQPWAALVGIFLKFSAQMGVESTPLPSFGAISGTASSFQSGGALASWRGLTIESL